MREDEDSRQFISFIQKLRGQQGYTLEQVCEGICSPGTLLSTVSRRGKPAGRRNFWRNTGRPMTWKISLSGSSASAWKKAYFLSAFIWCLLVLAACGKEAEEDPRYYEIRVESGQLEEAEKGQYLLGQQYYQGEPVSILAEPSEAEGSVMDVYICPMGGEKKLLMGGVSREYRTPGWYLDEKGGCYIKGPTGVTRLDADGKMLYQSKMEDVVMNICCLEGGSTILLTHKDNFLHFWELDPDTGKTARIDQASIEGDKAYISASGKNLMLLNEQGFWRMNLEKGTKELVLPFAGSFYTIKRKGETPADFRVDGSEAGILWSTGKTERLERVDITGEKEIITVRGNLPGFLERQAELFNQSNSDLHVVVKGSDGGVDFHTETNLQLASGKGADIICSNAVGDVSGLIEKDVFVDLAPLMEASGIREEDFFPAAFGAWREGGQIYGIVPNVSPMSYVLNKEVCNGREELTIEGLVDSMLEFEENRVFISGAKGSWILNYFLQGSENLWGMVDWENRTCDFSGELFAKMLRAANRYAADDKHQYPSIADYRWCDSLYDMDTPKALETKKQVDIGVFFDDGNYAVTLEGNSVVMGINAESEHVEAAWKFLAFLLGEEAQAQINYLDSVFPVNRNVFEGLIQYEFEAMNAVIEDEHEGNVYTRPSNIRFGQTFTEEQADEVRRVYEGVKTLPYKIQPLLAIIKEETAYYFDGSKSVEEIIPLVQNRVQLYLDEMSN